MKSSPMEDFVKKIETKRCVNIGKNSKKYTGINYCIFAHTFLLHF